MNTNQLDLILHPIRMRIVLHLTQGSATTNAISQSMSDIAPATLYRHIKALSDGGILQVIAENQIRGTVEKVYALVDTQSLIAQSEDITDLSAEDYMRLFTAFAGTLLGDFAVYLENRTDMNLDLEADGVGFHKRMLFMTDKELIEFIQGFQALIAPYLEASDNSDRRARLFSTIIMPSK